MSDGMGVRGARRWAAPAGVLVLALLVSACEGGVSAELSARPPVIQAALDLPPVPTSEPPLTSTTVLTTEPSPPGLGVGAVSPAVLTLEQKLASLHYYVGDVDQTFDANTRDAVMGFQKVTGMDRTGRATDDVVAAVEAAKDPPSPLVPKGGFKRVEIDLDRQVLFLYELNNLALILPVSSGSNERFCDEGWCRMAVTPPGSFVLYDQRSGWEKSPLGWLYNSQYFDGGIAIHGSQSVPGYPASHGCVRISMSAAEWFPERLSVGTPVYVVSADQPSPTPIGLNPTPTSTPTTIVPDTVAPSPTTTTTAPNLLSNLLTPPTTRP